MKFLAIICCLCCSPALFGQDIPLIDTSSITSDSVVVIDSSAPVEDSRPKSILYGTLLHDDPVFNPRYKVWLPAVRVVSANVFNWALAKYFFKYDWPATSIQDWRNNFKYGWEWDVDRFGTNFIGHPHTGSYYFNIARANGYSFWQSLPFAIQGSLIWEYLGENARPSINDIINTPVSGLFLGEIFYRVSSNILDDRSRGGRRVFKEALSGIINPSRALNRLTQGKMFRVTDKEVYQKEPMNVTFHAGYHKVNNAADKSNRLATGDGNAVLHMQLDYGDPFEARPRKPYDVFRLRIELGYGKDVHLIDNVNGYGFLFGKTVRPGRLIAGAFQHFDYWRNNTFEVGTMGFGGGFISKVPIKKSSNLYSSLHMAVVPLAGNNSQFGPSDSEFRTYNFGGGLQAKVEEMLNIGNWMSLGFTGFYYWIKTYHGLPGSSLVGILKPMVTVKLVRNLRVGLEHLIYRNDRFLEDERLHITQTEQKVFIQLFFEDSQRRGRYN